MYLFIRKVAFERAYNRWITLKGHLRSQKWGNSIAIYQFLLVVWSYNVSILHRFRYLPLFIVRDCVSDLQKSFSFDTTVEMSHNVRLPVRVQVVNTCYISRGTGVRKVSSSKSDVQGNSRSLVLVPFVRQHMISYYTASQKRVPP